MPLLVSNFALKSAGALAVSAAGVRSFDARLAARGRLARGERRRQRDERGQHGNGGPHGSENGRTAHNHLLKEYTACLHRREPLLHRPGPIGSRRLRRQSRYARGSGGPSSRPAGSASRRPAPAPPPGAGQDNSPAARSRCLSRDPRTTPTSGANIRLYAVALSGPRLRLEKKNTPVVAGRRAAHQIVVGRTVQHGAVHGLPRRHRHEDERHPARYHLHGQARRRRLVRGQAERRRGQRAVRRADRGRSAASASSTRSSATRRAR